MTAIYRVLSTFKYRGLAFGWILSVTSSLAMAGVWLVDPAGTYPNLQSVKNQVQSGDTILIQAAHYVDHPQVVFGQSDLCFKGVNGLPRLEGGALLKGNSNGKAILVLSGSDCVVENLEFANVSVPDGNGAGIRQEGCDLTVRYCTFSGNEMGILGGNYSPCKVVIEHCIFRNNGNQNNPGYQHNVYINHIDTLIFRYNYSSEAAGEGHELKSRAHVNIISYNYIANHNSTDSRNIDLPNGGQALVLGNVIEQGPNSVNSNLLGFGLEGLSNRAPHNLLLAFNTFVNTRSKGSFIQVPDATDTLLVWNNILAGAKTGGLIIGSPSWLDSGSNFIHDEVDKPGFAGVGTRNYRLTEQSPCRDAGQRLNQKLGSYGLMPNFQYVDTSSFEPRTTDERPDIGAYEYPTNVGYIHPVQTEWMIFPNPLTGNWLYTPDRHSRPFELYSVDGKCVYRGVFQEGKAYIGPMPNGLYVLHAGAFRSLLRRLKH